MDIKAKAEKILGRYLDTESSDGYDQGYLDGFSASENEKSDLLLMLSMATKFTVGSDSNGEIEVAKRNADLWAVIRQGCCFDTEIGHFTYEPSPSNRTDEYLKHTRFSFSEAFKIAQELAKK